MFVYLDNSATTRQYDEVTDMMADIMRNSFGNPSSLHRMGLDAEKLLRAARKQLAGALGAGENEIFFTSGGTESDNTALLGAAEARGRKKKKIITTAVEHPAVLMTLERLEAGGFEIVKTGVNPDGSLKTEELEQQIDENTVLISVMQVNNESGTIMPVETIGRLKEEFNKKHGTNILFHTDAVQSFGKMKVLKPGVDMASFSAHKIHGPKGVGALYLKKGIHIPAFITGGGQESGFRSGTENLPCIAGFGLAAEKAYKALEKRMEKMGEVRDYLLAGLKAEISDIRLNGVEKTGTGGEENLACPSVLNVSFAGTRGEVLLHTLEQSEIYVSTGSACASNHKGMSHVLRAMGLKDKDIEGAVRFSFNEFNTIEEMDFVIEKTKQAVSKFRRLGSFR
ncbi:MAG: cysteine desulfurase [Clostridia bacterium]|nr:cysteine desulfurase [Clostridia bacterium]